MRISYPIGMMVIGLVYSMVQPSHAQSVKPIDQVQVEDVRVLMSEMGPVVLLKADNRVVPIFVDPTVAGSIDGVLRGKKSERPLSHDLMHTILQEYGGRVTKVKITLKGKIFYGELEIAVNGDRKVFDSRSSDAIALAIHFDAPIFVEKDLLDQNQEEPGQGVDPRLL